MKLRDIKTNFFSKLILILPFLLYFLIATYKLAEPSLWVDEAIEYMTSSETFTNLNGMLKYASLQPPLYSWILLFWLKVNHSVFWFRLLSVLFGFLGAVGFYKSVKEVSGQNLALFSVVIYSCVFRLVYHFQEGAEYALMVGGLCWLAYYFIKTIREMNTKNIILFTFFSALSFLSQYGATAVVVTFAFLLLLTAIKNKDKAAIKSLLYSYLANFLFVVIPVLYSYTRYQFQMESYVKDIFAMSVDENIFCDFVIAIMKTIRYNFFPNLTYETKEIYMNFHIPDIVINILIFFFLSIFTVAAVKVFKLRRNIIFFSKLKNQKQQKNLVIKYLLWSSIIAWVTFYVFVKLGLYSYGVFGFRWGLFITPLWLLTIIVTINEFLSDLRISYKNSISKKGTLLSVIAVFLTVIYCLTGVYGVYKHWEKENNQGMVQKWYEIKGYKEKTVVYYGSAFAFSYYLKKDKGFKASYHDDTVYLPWFDGKTYDEYDIMFNELLDNNFNYPVIYFCTSHTADDINTMLKVFANKGYKKQVIYNSYDATIYKLNKNIGL